jgi:hypothetical protein
MTGRMRAPTASTSASAAARHCRTAWQASCRSCAHPSPFPYKDTPQGPPLITGLVTGMVAKLQGYRQPDRACGPEEMQSMFGWCASAPEVSTVRGDHPSTQVVLCPFQVIHPLSAKP